MKSILGVGIVAIAAAMSMGCAAQGQCLRQVNELQATAQDQDRQIRDLQGKVAVVRAEQAGTTVYSLATEAWDSAMSGLGWAKAEAPIAVQQGTNAYNSAADRLARARQCYTDQGGNRGDLSYDDYKRIATNCLGGN